MRRKDLLREATFLKQVESFVQTNTQLRRIMVSHNEAMPVALEYFDGDELAASVFLSKYALTTPDGDILESSPEAMHRRLAREFARIEARYTGGLSEDRIYNLLKNFKFIIPQGSPMAGIGNPYQVVSLSNCFVIDSPADSFGGIMKADQEEAQIMKRRGGVGFDISTIRPRGLPTSNAAKTTDGIGVFMERFSNTCREVAQGGRRGALMLSISVHHPEIKTFINIKRDLKKVTGANISIRLTDEFMNAVKNETNVQLRWPVDSTTPSISQVVSAKDLWTEIVESAHASAEPGLLFWDTIDRRTPTHCYPEFKSTSTNPCQPEWATVLTPEGIKTFKQIDVGSTIWSGKRWTKVTNKVMTGVKPVLAYKTRAGVFYGTENHRVVSDGVKIEVAEADSIDVCVGSLSDEQKKESLDSLDIMDGLVWGDGMTHKASNYLTVLLVGKDDQCYFQSEIKDLLIEPRPGITEEAWLVKTRNELLPKTYNRELSSDFVVDSTSRQKRGFLRGLYSANGSVVANRVTLKSSCKKLVEQVQLMLSSLGISSYYTVNKSHDVEFSNGTYECRESYDLNIGDLTSRKQFSSLVGFIHPSKTSKLLGTLDCEPSSKGPKKTYDIVETELLGEERVWDITVEADEHTYWTGGLLVSNCGEIVLSPYDSCRLLLVNTVSFVEDPFTPNARFDYVKYAEVVRDAQRLMDDIVDLEVESVDRILAKIEADPEPEDVKAVEVKLWNKIRAACISGRRTGLGVTAVGDMVAAMNVRYGSDESVDLIEEVYKHLALGAYRSTVELAKERGAFPAFNYELEKNHEFLNQIMDLDPVLRADWEKYGRRNIALTTTAPAGSVSVLTQTTSGIEPAFLLNYTRRKKINPADRDKIVPDFVDELGDAWQEFTVYHHWFKKWMDVTGKVSPSESPYYGATSADIDWVNKVKAQAAAQKWICHSISNTTNVPNNTSVETVKDIYMTGWETGCKGVTIYRDGSRSGVLVSADEGSKSKEKKGGEQSSDFDMHHAPKRPKELPCEIHTMTVNGEKWTFFIGKMSGLPYEIMGGLSKFVNIPRRVKTGKIIKHNGPQNPVARYDLHYDFEKGPEDEAIIKDITSVFDNATHAAFTRTISLALRHGTPVQYIAEQIQKGSEKEDDLFSFSRAIGRVLKQYIQDGTKVSSDKKCPDCGASDLTYQEGCATCISCGYSKCK